MSASTNATAAVPSVPASLPPSNIAPTVSDAFLARPQGSQPTTANTAADGPHTQSPQQPPAATGTEQTPGATATNPEMTPPTSGMNSTPEKLQPTGDSAPQSVGSGSEAPQRTVAQILQAQIDTLTDFTSRIRALRQSPVALLRAGGTGVSFDVASASKTGFSELKRAQERLLQDEVQAALKAAAESERKDRSGVQGGLRREVRKRRRSPTPESPKPYIPPKARSVFPTLHPSPAPLTCTTLPDFVRGFNAAQRAQGRKISIRVCLRPGEPRLVAPPLLVRFEIADVLKAYLTLDVASNDDNGMPVHEGGLMVENIAVFGSREKRPPHSQSAFYVFQRMSQEIVRMIQAMPRVPLQTLTDMLATYQDVFTAKCAGCERVLSPENYLPPIARVWREDAEGHGVWEIRHVSCPAARH